MVTYTKKKEGKRLKLFYTTKETTEHLAHAFKY